MEVLDVDVAGSAMAERGDPGVKGKGRRKRQGGDREGPNGEGAMW